MSAYYNENDPFAADWLEELIRRDVIAPGEVDRRDIRDVRADDLIGFRQCHFFAGIGIFSAALRAEGWDDDEEIWTGSCPCGPFSVSGKKKGFDDERHLWPAWEPLIRERRPPVITGEQVASPDGLRWLDLVSDNLEEADYAIGAADLCAPGAGLAVRKTEIGDRTARWLEGAIQNCPDPFVEAELRDYRDWFVGRCSAGPAHVRQRLYFVGMADDESPGRNCGPGHGETGFGQSELGRRDRGAAGRVGDRDGEAGEVQLRSRQPGQTSPEAARGGRDGRMVDRERAGLEGHARHVDREAGRAAPGRSAAPDGPDGRVADQHGRHAGAEGLQRGREHGLEPKDGGVDGRDGTADQADRQWRDPDWLFCRDGKWRPVEAGTFPLGDGHPGRMGRLRGYGNALDYLTARLFVRVVREIRDGV